MPFPGTQHRHRTDETAIPGPVRQAARPAARGAGVKAVQGDAGGDGEDFGGRHLGPLDNQVFDGLPGGDDGVRGSGTIFGWANWS